MDIALQADKIHFFTLLSDCISQKTFSSFLLFDVCTLSMVNQIKEGNTLPKSEEKILTTSKDLSQPLVAFSPDFSY